MPPATVSIGAPSWDITTDRMDGVSIIVFVPLNSGASERRAKRKNGFRNSRFALRPPVPYLSKPRGGRRSRLDDK